MVYKLKYLVFVALLSYHHPESFDPIVFLHYLDINAGVLKKIDQESIEERRARLQSRLEENLYTLQKKDKKRFFDCMDDLRTPSPQPFRNRGGLSLFTSENIASELNGMIRLHNDWPVLVSLHNLDTYRGKKSRIFIGFRGMEWGIHKTPMTKDMLKFIKKYSNDILLLPDSYMYLGKEKNIERSKLMAVCHARYYPKIGERISKYWPGFHRNGSWDMVNRIFLEHENIYLIGWSNGSFPRSQFIETRNISKETRNISFKNIKDYKKFAELYSQQHEFISEEIHRVQVIVDIETNYSGSKPLWNLVKYLKDELQFDQKKLYYGISSLNMPPTRNYIKLIQIFDLKGKQLSNGVIRYQNPDENIVIDIFPLSKRPFYRYGNINLNKTNFQKNTRLKKRLVQNHQQIVGYSLRQLDHFIQSKDGL